MVKPLRVLIILATLVIAGSAFYYFVVFPNKKQATNEKNQQNLTICLKEADSKYDFFWEKECRNLGFQKGCRLNKQTADRVDQLQVDAKNDCYNQFPVSKN